MAALELRVSRWDMVDTVMGFTKDWMAQIMLSKLSLLSDCIFAMWRRPLAVLPALGKLSTEVLDAHQTSEDSGSF